MPSGTTGAIKGGLAYVQAYLDDNPLNQGLAKLSAKLKQWQASLSKLGAGAYGGELPEPFAAIARFAASPAGAFSALVAAAEHAAEARAAMYEMSETTGVAIEKLSQYAYAARRAGVSNEAFANALKRMQGKEFQAMLQGIGGKGGGAKALTGAVVGQLGKGDAVDQLRNFIRLTENMPTAEKIGLARRLGLSELIPLINQGIDGLDAFTARAKELGLVMTEEDARAGKRFSLAVGDLHDVLMSSVSAIGGALVPLITGLSNVVVRVAAAVRDWIKDHKALTQLLFYGTGAIVAGGIALKAFSLVAGMAARAVTVLKLAFGGLKIALSALQAAFSFAPLLANPFVLAGIAVGGLLAWLAKLSGAFDGLGDLWSGVSRDFSDSFAAIANALSKGDIEGAWNVVTAFLKTEWVRATNYLAEAWGNFKDYFWQVLDQYAPWVHAAVKSIGAAWDWLWDSAADGMKWLGGAWKTVCDALTAAFGAAIKVVHSMWDGLLDKIAEAQKQHDEKGMKHAGFADEAAIRRQAMSVRYDPDQAVKNAKAAAAAQGVGLGQVSPEAMKDVVSAADARRQDAKLQAANQAADLEQRKRSRALDAEQRLAQAQISLKQAIDAANAPGKDVLHGAKGGDQAAMALSASEHRGTFSGAVASMLGGGGMTVQQQQLNIAKQDLENSQRWRDEAKGASKEQRAWADKAMTIFRESLAGVD